MSLPGHEGVFMLHRDWRAQKRGCLVADQSRAGRAARSSFHRALRHASEGRGCCEKRKPVRAPASQGARAGRTMRLRATSRCTKAQMRRRAEVAFPSPESLFCALVGMSMDHRRLLALSPVRAGTSNQTSSTSSSPACTGLDDTPYSSTCCTAALACKPASALACTAASPASVSFRCSALLWERWRASRQGPLAISAPSYAHVTSPNGLTPHRHPHHRCRRSAIASSSVLLPPRLPSFVYILCCPTTAPAPLVGCSTLSPRQAPHAYT